MEKHLICAYCGKEYIATSNTDCCPFCGSFNDFTVTKSDKFLSKFNKFSKVLKIIFIIIAIVIILSGLKNLFIHIWYTKTFENIETYQYYYSENFIENENNYIDKSKQIDESIQVMVESENYDVIKLFDELIAGQFYGLDLLVDLDTDLNIKDTNVYLSSCEFHIYDYFAAFRLLVEIDEEVSFKKGEIYVKDSNNNKYYLDYKKSIDDIGKLQDAFKDDFVGEIYGYLDGDFYAFKDEEFCSNNFIKFESIVFEIDGKEYECPINYDNIYGANLTYWGVS